MSGDDQKRQSHNVPDNHLPLERVHAILDSMSAATPETSSKSKRKKPQQKDEQEEEIDEDEVDLVVFLYAFSNSFRIIINEFSLTMIDN